MGICTDNGMMISALNSQLGTLQTTIADGAPPGELLFVRRIKGIAAGSSSGSSSANSGSTNQGSAFGNWFLQSLGFPSGDLSDLLERASMILLGAGLLLIGVWMLAGTDKVLEVTGLAVGEPEVSAAVAAHHEAEKSSSNANSEDT